jgi:hypothetical protein
MPHCQLRALLILDFLLSGLSGVQAAPYTVTPLMCRTVGGRCPVGSLPVARL